MGDDRSSGLLTLAFSLKWILEEGEERSGFGVGDGEEPEGVRWARVDKGGTDLCITGHEGVCVYHELALPKEWKKGVK